MYNYSKGIIVIILVIIGFASCEEGEGDSQNVIAVACFSYNSEVNEVSFNSDCSQNANAYNWQFGDGNFSSTPNPTNVYDSAGTFDVVLEVTSSTGSVDLETAQVTIQEMCLSCNCTIDTFPTQTVCSFDSSDLADLQQNWQTFCADEGYVEVCQ